MEQLENAQSVIDNGKATQDEVDSAKTSLQEAINGLLKNITDSDIISVGKAVTVGGSKDTQTGSTGSRGVKEAITNGNMNDSDDGNGNEIWQS